MGAGSTPAGWYPDVERPGGERYWDGSMWTEQRRNPGDAPPAFPPAFPSTPPASQPSSFDQQPLNYAPPTPGSGQPPTYSPPGGGGYGQPNPQAAFGSPEGYTQYGAPDSTLPKSSAPAWALGLSIAGLVLSICCVGFVLSIPGSIMGWSSMKAIDRGEKDPGQRGTAKAAFIVGLIGLAIAVGWIALIAGTGTFDWTVGSNR